MWDSEVSGYKSWDSLKCVTMETEDGGRGRWEDVSEDKIVAEGEEIINPLLH